MRSASLLIIAVALSAGCRYVSPSRLAEGPRDVTRDLIPNETTKEEVLKRLGEPVRTKDTNDLEVWTYEWKWTEERSAYSGTRIGEEREALHNPTGYTHYVTRTTVLNLIFNPDGVLVRHQTYSPESP